MKRLLAVATVPAVLAAGLIAVTGYRDTAAAAPLPNQVCILGMICLGGGSPGSPTASPSGTPSPSSSSPSPSPSAGTPAPSASPTADPSPTGTPSPTGSSSPTGRPSGSASPSPSASATSPAPSPSPSRTAPAPTAAHGGLVAANATWVMTAASATMTGFTYQGNVNVPIAGGGTVEMMEFTASSADFTSAVTSITEAGNTATENDASFTASGVTLYATQLSGSVLGRPLTFTPSTALTEVLTLTQLIPGGLPVITMTGVTADQTIISASQAQKNSVTASV